MLDFLKPKKGRPETWRRLCWWQHVLHRLLYDLSPIRRCYWCGRWYLSGSRFTEYCSKQCCDEELDRLKLTKRRHVGGKLWWLQINGPDVWANSRVWHDQGVPLPYIIRYDLYEEGEWIATFKGAELARGNLADCIEACQQHEEESES